MITHTGCWENSRKAFKSRAEGESFTSISSVLPTSQVGYHAGKPIESVVYCFYKITLKHVSVFYEFTGTINHRFLTNQNARTMLVILQKSVDQPWKIVVDLLNGEGLTSHDFVARLATSRSKKLAPLAKKLVRSTCSKSTWKGILLYCVALIF